LYATLYYYLCTVTTERWPKQGIKFLLMIQEILNASMAAEFLGMTKGLLYKLTSQHRIPYYKPCGKRIMFKRSELEQWVNAGRVPTNAELREKGGAR